MVRGCCKEGVPVAEPGLTVLVGHERVEGPPADTGNCPGETAFERCLKRSPPTSAPSPTRNKHHHPCCISLIHVFCWTPVSPIFPS